MSNIKLEIRCCCIPEKILGWKILNIGEFLMLRNRDRIKFKKHINFSNEKETSVELTLQTMNHDLVICELYDEKINISYFALNSNDQPISEIIKINKFIPNLQNKLVVEALSKDEILDKWRLFNLS